MRRKNCEVTDLEKIELIISSCHCCRIGFYDHGQIYIVPLNYGYVRRGDIYTFYFHSAKEGRKINLVKESPHVGFELDTNFKLHTSDVACGYSNSYQSIIGNGKISVVEDDEEKRFALIEIMKHYTNSSDWHFSEKMLQTVCILKLTVETMSCKEHL